MLGTERRIREKSDMWKWKVRYKDKIKKECLYKLTMPDVARTPFSYARNRHRI